MCGPMVLSCVQNPMNTSIYQGQCIAEMFDSSPYKRGSALFHQFSSTVFSIWKLLRSVVSYFPMHNKYLVFALILFAFVQSLPRVKAGGPKPFADCLLQRAYPIRRWTVLVKNTMNIRISTVYADWETQRTLFSCTCTLAWGSISLS